MCNPEQKLLAPPRSRCHVPAKGDGWRLLLVAWAELGYEGEPPRCMVAFADAALEALMRE